MACLLFVNLEGKISGAESSLLLMIKHLQNKYSINVACQNKSPLSKALVALQIQTYNLPKSTRYKYSSILSSLYWLKISWQLIKIIKKVNPDIIHANSFYAGLPSLLASIVTRKKLLIHARDLTEIKYLSKLFGHFSKKIVAISNNVKSSLVKQGINPEKVKVIYNGIENNNQIRSQKNKNFFNTSNYYDNNGFVFANVGQFVPWKNQIVFLRAASRISHNLPNARFVLIGDDIFGRNPEYKSHLLNYAKNLSIANRVDFLGWKENMNEVWPNINCLVHTAEREPFGRVIIEAMSHRIPVVAINSGGPGEIIQNGINGTVVQPGNITALSSKMLKVAQDKEYAIKIACAGYKYVISNLTADKTAKQIDKVYEEILNC